MIKRLALFFLLACSFATAQTTSFTANLKDLVGNIPGAYVELSLKNCAGSGTTPTVPHVNGVGVIVFPVQLYPNVSTGVVSGNPYDETQIVCGSSAGVGYYHIAIYQGDATRSLVKKLLFADDFDVQGTTFNLNSATPRSGSVITPPVATAVLTNPAGNQTIVQPGGSTLAVTGNFSVSGTASFGTFSPTKIAMVEGTAPAGIALSDILYADSTAHRFKVIDNNGTATTPALFTDNLGVFAATTSAQLAGVISDETGSGALVFAGGNIGAATGTSLNLGATGVLSTTAQSGTGSICMTVNCVMTTPNIGAASASSISNTGDYTNTALATVKWGSSGLSTPDTGISRIGPASIGFGNGTQGNNTANMQAGSYYLNSGAAGVWGFIASMFDQISTGCVRWSSGANATTGIDSGICRGGAAATLAIGNGTANDASGTLKATNLLAPSGSSLAIPTVGASVLSDTATQTPKNKTLTAAGSGNNVTLLNIQGGASAIVGNAADQTVYTFTIPANTIAAGKGVRVRAGAKHSTGAAAVTYKIFFGTTALFTAGRSDAGTAANVFQAEAFNTSGQTAQVLIYTDWFGNVTAPGVLTNTSAENTANAVVVKLTFNVAATDQVTPLFFIVELVQ